MRRFSRGGLTFRRRRKEIDWKKTRPFFGWAFQIAVVIACAFVVVHFFGFQTTMVGDAMNPTASSNDVILVNRMIYKVSTPKSGDVIAFLPNGNEKSHYYIRRVVGVPGDTVQIVDGELLINGEVYELAGLNGNIEVAGLAEDEITLDKDEYFVIGDNPNSSEDSRHTNVGMVSLEDICGKAWFCISPRSDFGSIN